MALRRWKPFLGTFDHIDAAIESASAGGLGREDFKRARNRIVETLCGTTDNAVAEGICRLLDDAMAESLVTLRMAVHPDKRNLDLLVPAIGDLARWHASERIRGLARDLVRGWRAAIEADLATARAAMAVLDRVSPPTTMPRPEDTVAATCVSRSFCRDNASPDLDSAAATTMKQHSAVPVKKQPRPRVPLAAAGVAKIAEPAPLFVRGGGSCVKSTSPNVQASSTKAPAPQQRPKKTATSSPPAARKSVDCGDRATTLCDTEDTKKMQATKRKLQERYQEAEDAKRRRTIQVLVVAPEMRRQHKTLPAVKARGPAFSASENRTRFSKSAPQPPEDLVGGF